MSQIKALAGQTIIYGLSSILPRILHYIVFTIYLTYKFADQSDFAVYLDLYAYASIVLVLFVYRMDTAFFRFGKPEVRNKVYGTAILPMLLTLIVSVSIMYVFSEQLATWLSYPGKGYYIIWFAFILGFDALVAVPYAKMRLDNKPTKFLFYRLINIIVTILMVLFFLEVCPKYAGDGSWLGSIYQEENKVDYLFLANLIASSLVALLMLPEFLKIKFDFDFTLWKKMFWYSLPLVIVGIAGNINQSFAVPLQKYFLGESLLENMTNAGIYGAAAKMALLLNLFTVAFNYAAEPFFFNNADKKDKSETYGLVALAFTICACLVLLVISFFMDPISIMLGSDYRSAITIVPILLFAYLFLGLYYNFSIWYKLNDMTYVGAIIAVIGALITLSISIYLLEHMGYIASAWAALACYSFMAVAGWATGKKYYPINYPMRRIMSYIICAAILVVVSLYLRNLQEAGVYYTFNIISLIGFISFAYLRDGKRLLKI